MTKSLSIRFRRARAADLEEIIALLAEDEPDPGDAHPENPSPAVYREVFDIIEANPNGVLIVGEWEGAVVGCVHLHFLPGLGRRGAWRAQVQDVHVARRLRRKGIGQSMIRYAIGLAKARQCYVIQLTLHKAHQDAKYFYEHIGLAVSHEGITMLLN